MEGGSDRLALISGRVHSMDPLSSPNSFSGQSSTYSTPGDNYRGHAYSESDSGINNTVFFPDHRHGMLRSNSMLLFHSLRGFM